MTGSLKRDFASGLVVLIPLLVTFYALRWLYRFVAGFPLVEQLAPTLPVIGAIDPELSRVLVTIAGFLAVVLGIGYLMRTAFGRVLEDNVDRMINRLPGFRMVYNASKMAVETAVSGDISLRNPSKVKLWGDVRLTAFHTGKRSDDDRQILFVPTSPNVTSGFVIEVEDEDIISTDESLEEALTRVISAGFGERRVDPSEIETPEDLEEVSKQRREDEHEATPPEDPPVEELPDDREPVERTED